jgi:hypothetical protein
MTAQGCEPVTFGIMGIHPFTRHFAGTMAPGIQKEFD